MMSWLSLLLAVLIAALPLTIYRRRKYGVTGWKSWLAPVCFFSAGLVGLIQLWLPVFGIYAWLIQLILLIAGSYFTKYMLPAQKEQRTE
ncbi:hypothetical protein [Domibacillus robiginosus]|uniref:hypothetical protein n=1 Tax=Domibacillus robiginosus TaxID=1071054 RepID=UPI0012DFEE42|nr:hypothetical protein [Domibacillus robiginosus]